MEQADPAAYTAFRGRTDRSGPAVLAWAVGIATGVYVWTCLAMILLCRILMQALAVTVPLMAVVGILPTGWGFLQSAWDRFTAALIGVAKFTLASGIMTIVLGAVMAAPMSAPAKLLCRVDGTSSLPQPSEWISGVLGGHQDAAQCAGLVAG